MAVCDGINLIDGEMINYQEQGCRFLVLVELDDGTGKNEMQQGFKKEDKRRS